MKKHNTVVVLVCIKWDLFFVLFFLKKILKAKENPSTYDKLRKEQFSLV